MPDDDPLAIERIKAGRTHTSGPLLARANSLTGGGRARDQLSTHVRTAARQRNMTRSTVLYMP